MILHHYRMSPFSEKIRLMCGYAGLAWQGVINPEMPPRPVLDPMLGGYRRIPVAQAGADLFCDTRLISAEVAALSNRPELDPANCDEAELGFSAGLESEVFWACVASLPATQIIKQLVRNISIVGAFRFIRDRAGVARRANSKPMKPREAIELFDRHLAQLEQRLQQSGDFLFGDAPRYTDFAAYHTFWFQRVVGELPMPEGLPAVEAWYSRMGGFGHGDTEEISGEAAFAAARASEPRPVPDRLRADAHIGRRVTIRPVDYARDGGAGELVGADARRWIIARDTDFGRLHVHFPTEGFELVNS
jgi:glutathione S-transferase